MSLGADSTLQLVENETTENREYNTDRPKSPETAKSENAVKTILNDAFEDVKAGNKDSSDVSLTPCISLEILDSASSSDVSESAEAGKEDVNTDIVLKEDSDKREDERVPGKAESEENHGERGKEIQNKSELQTPVSGLQSSSSSKSIIIDEKETVEVFFKSDETIGPVAELDITSAVTVQPSKSLSVKSERDSVGTKAARSKANISEERTMENRKVVHSDADYLHHDTDLDLYPLSADEHKNCCYRCWYSETCNACILESIDRIPDRCLCPCLLSCYRCLQVVLCCDWS